MTETTDRISDPASETGYPDHPERVGFFTDTSLCIGCKACEVACREWNMLPALGLELTGESYDNTGALGADTWRHVAFVEQPVGTTVRDDMVTRDRATTTDLGLPTVGAPEQPDGFGVVDGVRWLMSSDVCKHCTHAACLDVCPTGALFRTEFGTVVVQDDVCNGCGYCIPACPYGVIGRREHDGQAHKCTLCYDRLGDGLEPACAKACPTDSIQFGPLEQLRQRADRRVEQLHQRGVPEARLYGRDPADGVGGNGAFFLLLDEPEVYGLPPDPVVTTRDLPAMWRRAAVASASVLAGLVISFLSSRYRRAGGGR